MFSFRFSNQIDAGMCVRQISEICGHLRAWESCFRLRIHVAGIGGVARRRLEIVSL